MSMDIKIRSCCLSILHLKSYKVKVPRNDKMALDIHIPWPESKQLDAEMMKGNFCLFLLSLSKFSTPSM